MKLTGWVIIVLAILIAAIAVVGLVTGVYVGVKAIFFVFGSLCAICLLAAGIGMVSSNKESE